MSQIDLFGEFIRLCIILCRNDGALNLNNYDGLKMTCVSKHVAT
jgi:hypothetical protein